VSLAGTMHFQTLRISACFKGETLTRGKRKGDETDGGEERSEEPTRKERGKRGCAAGTTGAAARAGNHFPRLHFHD